MWHKHPEQQQRGIQLAPIQPAMARPVGAPKEAHADGEAGKLTARDATGAKQEGWAKPADAAAAPVIRRTGSAL